MVARFQLLQQHVKNAIKKTHDRSVNVNFTHLEKDNSYGAFCCRVPLLQHNPNGVPALHTVGVNFSIARHLTKAQRKDGDQAPQVSYCTRLMSQATAIEYILRRLSISSSLISFCLA